MEQEEPSFSTKKFALALRRSAEPNPGSVRAAALKREVNRNYQEPGPRFKLFTLPPQ